MHRDRFYLSDRIRMYIENSHLEGGGRLPSNEELAERFKVQKGTVWAALERLKEEGIVYSVKGVGTFAAEKKILRHMERFESFSQMAQENGSTVTTKLLSCRVIPAGNALTEEFGLTPRSDITETVRLRSVDREEAALEISYIPVCIAPDLQTKPLTGSLYRLLEEEYGIHLIRGKQTMSVRAADAREAGILNCSRGDALAVMEMRVFDENGVKVEYACSLTRGDRCRFTSILRMEEDYEAGSDR